MTITLTAGQLLNNTELTLVQYGNYTGSFDSIQVLIAGEDTCETLTALPKYGAQSFAVVLNADRSACKKKGLSRLAIIAIAVSCVIVVIVIVVILLLLFVFPSLARTRKRTKARTRLEIHLRSVDM